MKRGHEASVEFTMLNLAENSHMAPKVHHSIMPTTSSPTKVYPVSSFVYGAIGIPINIILFKLKFIRLRFIQYLTIFIINMKCFKYLSISKMDRGNRDKSRILTQLFNCVRSLLSLNMNRSMTNKLIILSIMTVSLVNIIHLHCS